MNYRFVLMICLFFLSAFASADSVDCSKRYVSDFKYYGGPVLDHVKVTAVFWGNNVNPETKTKIGDFYTALFNSTYLNQMAMYSTAAIKSVDGFQGTGQTIGNGTYEGAITIQPNLKSESFDDDDLSKELDSQITAGNLPKPDTNTLYEVYLPASVKLTLFGMSGCKPHGFSAYQKNARSQTNGNIFYTVILDPSSPDCLATVQKDSKTLGIPISTFDEITLASSHELMESISSPFSDESPTYPIAWLDQCEAQIADVCVDHYVTLKTPTESYILNPVWDRIKGTCNLDPVTLN